jgi:alkylhydroperoxidase family enzyme
MPNSCDYCIVSHTAAARKAGMNDAMLAELVSIVGMANATNRMVGAHRVEPDERLIKAATGGKKN